MSNKAPYSKAGLLTLIIALIAFAGLGIYFISTDNNGLPAINPALAAIEEPSSETIPSEVIPSEPALVTEVANEPAVTAEPTPEEKEAIESIPVPPAPETEIAAAEPAAAVEATAETPAVEASTENKEINLDAAKSIRALGDKNAPVKVVEYSSLTCSHCGHFHKETMKSFKEAYVDTGKVYMEFVDFPLNEPALQASLLARCLPEERYYPFVQMLFENQDKWAYKGDYLKYLKQNAQLAGLSSLQADACLKNEDLKKFITERMEEAQKTKNVNSTPTFIIGDKTPISGSQKLEEFSKIIDPMLADKKE